MEIEQQRILLRQRKLGILLYDARLSVGASIETCARLMGVTPNTYSDYEEGSISPSLPEIETLAFGINIPIAHFLGNQALSTRVLITDDIKLDLIRSLRQKMLGSSLLQERTQKSLSPTDVAQMAGITEEELNEVEAGNLPLPLSQLQLVTDFLEIPLESLFDQQGIIGQWRKQQERNNAFEQLPNEVQEFVSDPMNSPYLELAIRLSGLDAEKLRTIAESLLEITH